MMKSRHSVVSNRTMGGVLRLKPMARARPHGGLRAVLFILMLATLACALGGPVTRSKPLHIRRLAHLPTLTPTALATPVVIAPPAPTLAAGNQAAPVPVEPVVPTLASPIETPAESVPAASPEDQSSAGPILTALVNLNIRTGPSIDYPVVGKLAQGESAQIMGKNPEGTWWQVNYPPGSDSLAWISADTQYSTASTIEAVQIAQLPPPPPPTATPTPLPPLPPTPTLLPTPVPDAQLPSTSTPAPDETPQTEATATPLPSDSPGWVFTGVRLYPNDDNLLMYGNVINNTGALQALENISGVFYDDKGDKVSDNDNIYAYWPVNDVPPGASVPFELLAENLDDDVADFKLDAEAESSDDTPRQDFRFSEVNQWIKGDAYCVSGTLEKPDDELDVYLVIVLILHDTQDNIVKFADYGQFDSGEGVAEDDTDFEICIDPPYQDVARYELRAWGL